MSQNHVFTTEKQLFSRIYMRSQSYDFYRCFMYFCSIWGSFFDAFSHIFWVQFCSSIFNGFLVQKRCPKSTKNDPKIDPSASQGGVWLPGFIRSSLDMPFLRFLMPKWLPKWPKNDPKMTQPSSQWCPGPSKFRTFTQKVALGASWFQLSFSENPFDVILGASGPILANLLLVFWILSQACDFFRRIGVGRGGKHSFLDHTLQHQTFLQHHNLWLARCGLALQLGYGNFPFVWEPKSQDGETSTSFF